MLNNLIEVSKINPDMTDEILYKTFVQFFGDGYESASQVNAMCMEDERSINIYFCIKCVQVFGFLIYQIVVNPDVQTKLQQEIDDVFDGKEEGEDLSADDITNMTYLDQVSRERNRSE